jgi:hypothetical protein
MKAIVYIDLQKSPNSPIRKYPINATILHGWAVHKICSGWVDDTPKMNGDWWTITAPNGRALGWFETQGQALACIRAIKPIASAQELTAIPFDKAERTPEQHALAKRVMDIVKSYQPEEEGEL